MSADRDREELARQQERLGQVLSSADAETVWQQHLPEHAWDADGVRLAALLVAKLRFQRLMSASQDAATWFGDEPAAFAAAFREYHMQVTATSDDPWGEAKLFAQWRAERYDQGQ